MKKYLNKVVQGDCLEVMKKLSDKSIDMILCDLPYGTTPFNEWDVLINLNELWIQFVRIIKDNGVIALTGQEPFSSFLRTSMIDWYKYDWYWEKERLTNVFQVKRRPGKTIECISIFYKKQPTYKPQKTEHTGKLVSNKVGKNGRFSITLQGKKGQVKPTNYRDNRTRYPTQVLRINRDNNRQNVHPTQKPVALFEYLIKTYTNEKDLVLDCCIGSGTTAVACKNLNRNFIGIEINSEYCKIAEQRLSQEILF